MLRRGPEDTTPTNAAALTGLIHDHQVRDPRSADPGSLGKELHQHGGVQRQRYCTDCVDGRQAKESVDKNR